MPKGQHQGPSTTLGPLIERLGPLNNAWRFGSPAEKVLTLWDIGEALLATINNPNDALLWDIQEKSYITRNVLRYALIVRRGWPVRADLQRLITGLHSFTVFREALPFLKGHREHITDETYAEVVKALNDRDHRRAIAYVQDLKRTHIGRQHRKGLTTTGIKAYTTRFLTAITTLEGQLDRAWAQVAPPDTLIRLSQIAMGIASGETITGVTTQCANGTLADVSESLLVASKSRAANSSFRKAIGAERLMQTADFLNAIRSPESYTEWRKRRGL